MTRKLHIGGYYRQNGWEVLDANPGPHVDHRQDARDLSQFPEGCFAEIYASHVIEHFKYADVLPAALKEWFRVLEPGGRVYISVPDMDMLCRLFLTEGLSFQERFQLMRMLFGGQIDEHDVHMVGLNMEFLVYFLGQAGFGNIRKVGDFGLFKDSSSQLFRGVPISINVIADKVQNDQAGQG